MTEKIKNAVQSALTEATEARHKIHQNPELSFEEHDTSALICSTLSSHGIKYKSGIAGTGVLGIIKGEKPGAGKTLLIRADMDALPVTEQTGIDFCSKNSGVMHACGHDIHTSALLCCGIALNSLKDEFSGAVKLMFQPGEETTGGAEPMIAEGILKNPNVDCCIALHVEPSLKVGTAGFKQGAFYACPDEFDLLIKGRGGHAATPNKCVDPISIAARLVNIIESLPTRIISPLNPAAVSVCKIFGGSAYNVIPDTAQIGGSVRVFSDADRELLKSAIENAAKQLCAVYGADYEYEYRSLFKPLKNDGATIDMLLKSAGNYVKTIKIEEPTMAGEDFSYLTDAVKTSALFWLGCTEDGSEPYPLHSERFNSSDKCIEYGAEIFCDFALRYLK